jgi:ssDNA-binding Zn-finger/Zn-ribbon topoisomerase 1
MTARDRIRRPKTKTKTCAHCKRRRLRLKIEWHPGIDEWQCSNFTECDAAIERNEAAARQQRTT